MSSLESVQLHTRSPCPPLSSLTALSWVSRIDECASLSFSNFFFPSSWKRSISLKRERERELRSVRKSISRYRARYHVPSHESRHEHVFSKEEEHRHGIVGHFDRPWTYPDAPFNREIIGKLRDNRHSIDPLCRIHALVDRSITSQTIRGETSEFNRIFKCIFFLLPRDNNVLGCIFFSISFNLSRKHELKSISFVKRLFSRVLLFRGICHVYSPRCINVGS